MQRPLVPRLPPWVVDKLKHPIAAAAATTVGIRFGQDAARLRRGELSREEFEKRAAGHLGSLGGTVLGAIAGSAVGSIVPGVGTILGAFTGAMFGEMGGERLGRFGVDRLHPLLVKQPPSERPVALRPRKREL